MILDRAHAILSSVNNELSLILRDRERMESIFSAYSSSCRYSDIFGAFVTACIWFAFNKVIVGVSLCLGSSVTHKNVFMEYVLVWVICALNITAAVLIIVLYADNYYNLPWPMLRASMAMSCIDLIVSILFTLQIIKLFCSFKNRQVRENEQQGNNNCEPQEIVPSAPNCSAFATTIAPPRPPRKDHSL